MDQCNWVNLALYHGDLRTLINGLRMLQGQPPTVSEQENCTNADGLQERLETAMKSQFGS